MGEGSADATTGAAVCIPPTGAPGEVLVGTSLTGLGNHHVHAVAVDDAGDTYIAGIFSETLELQGTTVEAGPGSASAFVARLDCAGQLVWLNAARTVDAGASSKGYAVAVQGGRVVLGGELLGDVQFTGGELLAGGTGAGFIASFDAAEGAVAGSVVLAAETVAVRGLAIDDELVYAVGSCGAEEETGVLIAAWQGEADPGQYACSYRMEPKTTTTTANSVAVHADGGLVFGGQLSGRVEGWPDPGIGELSSRGFVARIAAPVDLAAPVVPAWQATFGGDGFTENRVDAVALRGDEVVVAARGTGLTQMRGATDIVCGVDDCKASGLNKHNTVVMRLGGDGSCIGASVLCSDAKAAEEAWGLAVTADRVYVTGQFDGSLRLGGQDLTTAPRPAGVRTFVLGLGVDLSRDADAWVLLSDDEGDTECGFVSAEAPTDFIPSVVRGFAIAAGPDGLVVAGSVCGPGLSLGGFAFTPNPHHFDGYVAKLGR